MTSFNAHKISENTYWVGAIDWELRDFHGYKTSRGTTYNAFLILGDEPVLIDTVKKPFFAEMMSRISSIIDPKKISYIISNHSEMDHSGSLPEAIEIIQPKKIFASKMGVEALKENLHLNAEITAINNQETLSLGQNSFTFVETRMLHWPDSMVTYFTNEKILFTQDGFGMHLATDKLFSDENDKSIMRFEAAKYYANILTPYSPLVANLLKNLPSLNLDIQIIAPDHGPIYRSKDEINWILNLWNEWALQKPYKKAVIVFDTMWGSTQQMAHAIESGLAENAIETKVFSLSTSPRSDIATELLESSALIVGSPTINQEMFPTVIDCLCYLRGLKFQNLCGQVFGSYGWAPHAIKKMSSWLEQMQIEQISQPIAAKYVPTNNDLEKCRDLGKAISQKILRDIH